MRNEKLGLVELEGRKKDVCRMPLIDSARPTDLVFSYAVFVVIVLGFCDAIHASTGKLATGSSSIPIDFHGVAITEFHHKVELEFPVSSEGFELSCYGRPKKSEFESILFNVSVASLFSNRDGRMDDGKTSGSGIFEMESEAKSSTSTILEWTGDKMYDRFSFHITITADLSEFSEIVFEAKHESPIAWCAITATKTTVAVLVLMGAVCAFLCNGFTAEPSVLMMAFAGIVFCEPWKVFVAELPSIVTIASEALFYNALKCFLSFHLMNSPIDDSIHSSALIVQVEAFAILWFVEVLLMITQPVFPGVGTLTLNLLYYVWTFRVWQRRFAASSANQKQRCWALLFGISVVVLASVGSTIVPFDTVKTKMVVCSTYGAISSLMIHLFRSVPAIPDYTNIDEHSTFPDIGVST